MGYRVPNTNVAVRIVHLRLGDEHMRRCNALRKEAGRCWTDLLLAHVASRDGVWLSETEMKAVSKGKYALHSQSVQALVEKLIANIDTATRRENFARNILMLVTRTGVNRTRRLFGRRKQFV